MRHIGPSCPTGPLVDLEDCGASGFEQLPGQPRSVGDQEAEEQFMLASGGDALTRATGRPARSVARLAPRGWSAAVSSGALRLLVAVGATYAALLAFGAAGGRAELVLSTIFGSEGAGDGQLLGPRGIGVDQTTLGLTGGDVYVADTGNARIEQFDSTGSFIRTWGWGVTDGASALEVCTSTCRAGMPGAGAGQLSNPTSIAVDSSTSPSQGDVYVGDDGNKVVDKFSPSGSLLATIAGPSAGVQFTSIAGIAVDPSGNLWVVDGNTDIAYEFDSSGTLLTQFYDNYGSTGPIAADAADNLYLIRGSGETEKWGPAARTGARPILVDSKSGTGLVVDFSTNDLFVDIGTSIDEWDATGKSLGNFGSGTLSQGEQITYNPNVALPGSGAAGALYVADLSANHIAVFVPPAPAAPAVQPGSETATEVTATRATINAKVSPNGLDTHAYFEYGLTTAYGSSTPAPPGADIGSNFAFEATTASLSGLSASTTYHFRVVAANAMGTTDGPDMTLTTGTPAAPAVNSETAANVTSTKATLGATINPQFADTHYIFEYGPTTAYGTQVPLPPGNDIGESNSEQQASFAITGLQPQTTYHFRVVATNEVGSTAGADETFTTTPPLKIDALLATSVTTTSVDLGAKLNGEGLSTHYHFEYGTTSSYGIDAPTPDGVIAAAEGDQGVGVHLSGLQPNTKYYFRVVATNFLGTVVGAPKSFTTYMSGEPTLADNRAYELVSPVDKNGGDVGAGSLALLRPSLQSGWGHSAVSGSAIAYSSFTSFGDAQSAGILTQYLSSRGPNGWTTHGISPPITRHTELSLQPGYHFFTAELTTGVLSWRAAALAPGAPEGEPEDLYVHSINASPYELVTLAAPGQTSSYQATFGGASADLRHIVFDASVALVAGAQSNAENVYEWVAGSLRLVSVLPGPGGVAAESAGAGDGETGENDLPENAVSADGSRVFWTDNNKQLFVRERGTTTVKLNTSQRTSSLGDGTALFMGATPDGSKVFFTDGTPLTNAPNDNGGLYEYDFSSGALRNLSIDSGEPPEVEGVAGFGEDGSSVYFVARTKLAGAAIPGGYNLYLSRDGTIRFIAALNSEDSSDWSHFLETRNARVTPDGEHLAFVSSAPLTGYDNTDVNSGSPDTEVFVYNAGSEQLSCASCNPSGVQPIGSATVPIGESTGHIPRFISDDGRRVFFDSKDALLPAAANGRQNVYEYENGAVHLISSGTSEDISAFVDASANGDDVFFITRAQLAREDTDNSADMYDARVGGGFAVPVSSQECAGEGCRGPLSAPPASLSIGTEAPSAAPEALPQWPQAGQSPQTARGKKKAKRAGRKRKPRKAVRRSKRSRHGRHRDRALRRTHRRGGRS